MPHVYRPGYLAEVDFFEVLVEVAGKRQKAWMLVVRLMHSGRDFAWLYPRQDQVCLIDGHVRAFEHFGAVPHLLAYDKTQGGGVARVLSAPAGAALPAAPTPLVEVSRRSLVKVDAAVYSGSCEWAGLDVTRRRRGGGGRIGQTVRGCTGGSPSGAAPCTTATAYRSWPGSPTGPGSEDAGLGPELRGPGSWERWNAGFSRPSP